MQLNLWLIGRFLIYVISRYYALVLSLYYMVMQLFEVAAVLGNLRHPVTRLVLCAIPFSILRIRFGITTWLSLPMVLVALGMSEQYLPTLFDGSELKDVIETKRSGLEELKKKN